jgi:Protein of unknown function (DUF3558)
MRRAVPLLAAVLLLAGCSETTTGSPTGAATGTSAGPTSAGPTSEASAKRPRTINVEDVDPCSLVTEAERPQFGLDRPPQKGTAQGFGWPTCTFSKEDRKYFLGITLATSEGVDFYDGAGPSLEIGGFPAVLVDQPGQAATCLVAIDVSDGQRVDAALTSLGAETPQETLCRLSQQVAAVVVANLMNK